MIIEGKKIITLTEQEREILTSAGNLLDDLADAIGNEDYFDFNELSETLYYILQTGKFEIDYTQK